MTRISTPVAFDAPGGIASTMKLYPQRRGVTATGPIGAGNMNSTTGHAGGKLVPAMVMTSPPPVEDVLGVIRSIVAA